jgi:proton-dependent oligopeptide transporter, POT family
MLINVQVKIVPQGSVLPQAARVLAYAARAGFKLEHAKPSYQEFHHQRTVPWSDRLVNELGRGLIACRVMCVPFSNITIGCSFLSEVWTRS